MSLVLVWPSFFTGGVRLRRKCYGKPHTKCNTTPVVERKTMALSAWFCVAAATCLRLPDTPKIAVLHDLLAWQGDVNYWTGCKIESSNNSFFRCVSYSAWPSWLPWRVPSVSWENASIILYIKTVLLRRAKRASPRILATSPKFSLHAVESMR